jgi:two-component system, OmpR family, sensor kinase
VKLRTALTLRVVVVIGFMLLVLGSFVVRQTRSDLLDQVDDRMRGALTGRIQDRPQRPQVGGPSKTEQRDSARLVFDRSGRLLRSTPSGTPDKPDPLPVLSNKWIGEQLEISDGPGPGRVVPTESGELRYRIMALRVTDGGLDVEATPLTTVDQSVADLIRTLTVASVTALGLVAITSFLLLRRALHPLTLMADAATRISQGDVSLKPGASGQSPHVEFNGLSKALDLMVGQLRSSIADQSASLSVKSEVELRLRRFISDASHELQTPITSIRGWAELYRQGGLSDRDSLNRAMARVETESARMGRLVDDLLTLTRADEQGSSDHRWPLSGESVDMWRMCRDCVTDAQVLDPSRVIELIDNRQVEFCEAWVFGNPDSLRQVLDNLMTNARRHTPLGTRIEVSLSFVGGCVEISVADEGSGFHPDHLERVFDRFWRSSAAVPAPTFPGGSGLGLSIVQAITTAHGGTVWAHNRPTGGAAVTIRIPSNVGSSNRS